MRIEYFLKIFPFMQLIRHMTKFLQTEIFKMSSNMFSGNKINQFQFIQVENLFC